MHFIHQKNRGQLVSAHALTFAIISLAVVAIVASLGIEIMADFADGIAVNTSGYNESAENITTVCNGVFGSCRSSFNLFEPAFIVIVAVVVIGVVVNLTSNPTDHERHRDKQKQGIPWVKEQYVEGDIQTTLKLEDELEPHIDVYVDNSDVDELDDLLDNGDETE